MADVQLVWATLNDVERLAPLFDAYRQFYDKPANLELSQALLKARLQADESKVVLALDDELGVVGFMQFYPLFDSLADHISAAKVMLLNDLFVTPQARGRGVAAALLAFAKEWAQQEGFAYLFLETAKTNLTAQKLYAAQGWVRDEVFLVYRLTLD